MVLFGWMDVLIIGKWNIPYNMEKWYSTNNPLYDKIANAPPIITTMIDIFLNMASNKKNGTDSKISYEYVFPDV
jgi:hypothetical protein